MLCQNCNGNILGQLEKRIENGEATDNDYYLWALKLRFLLSVKDSMLSLNLKDRSKGTLISKVEGFYGQSFVKAALQSVSNPNFIFKPNPFGSVFLFDNPIKDGQFGFVDAPFPYWGVSIALPNNKILAVLLTDKGMTKKAIVKHCKTKVGIQSYIEFDGPTSTSQLLQILLLKLLLNQYQIKNIPYAVSLGNNLITAPTIPVPNFRKKLKKDVYINLAQTLGLSYELGIQLYNRLPTQMQGGCL